MYGHAVVMQVVSGGACCQSLSTVVWSARDMYAPLLQDLPAQHSLLNAAHSSKNPTSIVPMQEQLAHALHSAWQAWHVSTLASAHSPIWDLPPAAAAVVHESAATVVEQPMRTMQLRAAARSLSRSCTCLAGFRVLGVQGTAQVCCTTDSASGSSARTL